MSAHSKTTKVPSSDAQPRPAADATVEQTMAEHEHTKPPTDATNASYADVQHPATVNEQAQMAAATEQTEQTNKAEGADKSKSPDLATILGHRIARTRFGVPTVFLLSVTALAGGTYFSWWYVLPAVVAWSNEVGWRWVIGWMGVFLSAVAPFYIVMFVWPLLSATLSADDKHDEVRALDDLDHVEQEIRGSNDPVDFARYSRKAMRAYYHMGQSQVKVSFYIGVFAMIFGFLFLLTGLLVQILDLSNVPYVRANPAVETVALGGGLIIEFVAATFLWIYRASIVQLNRYYRRQMLVHSALLSVTLTGRMRDSERDPAIASIVKILTEPDMEVAFPGLPRTRERQGAQSGNSPSGETQTTA